MTSRFSSLLLVLSIGMLALACGDRRSGGGIVIRHDTGVVDNNDDAGIAQHDTGVPPSGDAGGGGNDSGGGGNDSGGGGGDDAGMDDAGLPPVRVLIRDVQDESSPSHPAMDSSVELANVVVTAVQSSGTSMGSFWVEDAFGGPFSGVLIFVPADKVASISVIPGDRVTLNGTYKEYFEVSEIMLREITAQTAGAELVPMDVSPADIATSGTLAEAYEGVLVRVSSLTVISENPDAPMDFGEFTVTGNLRIDDQLFRLAPRPVADSFITSIVGVLHFSFSEFKLEPRSSNDYLF